MKIKTPQGSCVLLRYDNPDVFDRGRSIRIDVIENIRELSGPLGILWKAVRVPEGIEVYFAVEKQAIEAKLRWG